MSPEITRQRVKSVVAMTRSTLRARQQAGAAVAAVAAATSSGWPARVPAAARPTALDRGTRPGLRSGSDHSAALMALRGRGKGPCAPVSIEQELIQPGGRPQGPSERSLGPKAVQVPQGLVPDAGKRRWASHRRCCAAKDASDQGGCPQRSRLPTAAAPQRQPHSAHADAFGCCPANAKPNALRMSQQAAPRSSQTAGSKLLPAGQLGR